MENPEEILHSLEEFSKMKPKDIPRELEDYLCYVAKTGNPVYQWNTVKSLFREKLLSVITEFYEACPVVDIPPCPNVEVFNYELMKNFILEKLETFSAAPFTVQRICELLTTPRKEYNRIDKYMRALEKNILVVSTIEPGRRSTENGEGFMNGLESEHSEEHLPESSDSSHEINVDEMDDSPTRARGTIRVFNIFSESSEDETHAKVEEEQISVIQENFENEPEGKTDVSSSSNIIDSSEHIQQETCHVEEDSVSIDYVSIETVTLDVCAPSHQEMVDIKNKENDRATLDVCASTHQEMVEIQKDISVTITAIQDRIGEENKENDTNGEDMKKNVQPSEDRKQEINILPNEISVEEASSDVSCSESTEEFHSEQPKLENILLQETAKIECTTLQNTESEDAIQVEECSESEKNEPETTETSNKLTEEIVLSKNNITPEIVSSEIQEDEEKCVETTAESSTNFVPHVEVENVADSSTSLEEISESQEKTLEICEESTSKLSEAEEIKSPADTSQNEVTEAKVSENVSESIPMEVDLVSELETDKKIGSDEPSSTSTDISL